MTQRMAGALYYSSLTLSNVRSFGPDQRLDLRDADGRPAGWTLIVGDNGVGKTTLLECLALMRPVPTGVTSPDKLDSPAPTKVEAALLGMENAGLLRLSRGGDAETRLVAEFALGDLLGSEHRRYRSRTLRAALEVRGGDLKSLEGPPIKLATSSVPLVIAYGAGRHVRPYGREATTSIPDPVVSLFDASTELVDARRVLEDLDYAVSKKQPHAADFLQRLKQALCRILPDVASPQDIVFYGPAAPGSRQKAGVQVRTPYGEVPLEALSLGYQTMTAWTVDLAWRLFQRFPDSTEPLRGPAIVLVDELDLHLHPRWQRDLRRDVSEIFPAVQFVVTAHSPILAQSYLDMNLAVVRKEGGTAVIVNDPAVVRTWRIDEVCQSVLYDLESAFSPEIQERLERRKRLLQKARLSVQDKEEIAGLEEFVDRIDPWFSDTDRKAMAVIRNAAELLRRRQA